MAGVFQLILPFQLELPFEPQQAAPAAERAFRPRPLTSARGATAAGEGDQTLSGTATRRAARRRPTGAAE